MKRLFCRRYPLRFHLHFCKYVSMTVSIDQPILSYSSTRYLLCHLPCEIHSLQAVRIDTFQYLLHNLADCITPYYFKGNSHLSMNTLTSLSHFLEFNSFLCDYTRLRGRKFWLPTFWVRRTSPKHSTVLLRLIIIYFHTYSYAQQDNLNTTIWLQISSSYPTIEFGIPASYPIVRIGSLSYPLRGN